MKKLNLIIGLILAMSLMLAACNAANVNINGIDENNDTVPGTNNDTFDDDSYDDDLLDETATLPTEDLSGTVIIPETGSGQDDQTTPVDTQELSDPNIVNEIDPGLITTLMDYKIVSINDENIGSVDDFIDFLARKPRSL